MINDEALNALNEMEKKIYKVIQDKKTWRMPSYSTIMKKVGLKSKNSIHLAIKKLKRLKLI